MLKYVLDLVEIQCNLMTFGEGCGGEEGGGGEDQHWQV